MRRIEIIGNIGQDAELRMTDSGQQVANFRVAANGFKRDEEPLWVRVAIFGKRAEGLAKHLTKGSRVFCRGEFKLRNWSSEKSGQSGTDVEMVADEVELLGGGKDARSEASSGASPNW